MNLKTTYRKIIESKGGRVLEKRTTCQGISIGDSFKFQSLPTMKVICFFKDPVFDYYPMVLGADDLQNGQSVLCSISCIKDVKEHTEPIKRKRRI